MLNDSWSLKEAFLTPQSIILREKFWCLYYPKVLKIKIKHQNTVSCSISYTQIMSVETRNSVIFCCGVTVREGWDAAQCFMSVYVRVEGAGRLTQTHTHRQKGKQWQAVAPFVNLIYLLPPWPCNKSSPIIFSLQLHLNYEIMIRYRMHG